jgi:hypothetical protein
MKQQHRDHTLGVFLFLAMIVLFILSQIVDWII